MIKHLVISGGGPTGFLTYGAARYLAQNNYWNINDVSTIYGTSIGAFLGVLLSLNLSWAFLDNYFIETKWDKVLNLKPYNFIDAYSSKGIIQPNFIRDSLEPLFYEKQLDIDINLEEFHDFNNIDLHFYTTDLNSEFLKKIDISYKSHPELSLVKAIEMSTAYPILFKPIFNDGHCYIDGGLLNNLPVNDCIEQTKSNKNDILVFKNNWNEIEKLNEKSSIIDFIMFFILKLVDEVNSEKDQLIVPNTVNFEINKIKEFQKGKYNSWIKSINDKNNRKFLIQKGEYFAKKLIEESKKNKN